MKVKGVSIYVCKHNDSMNHSAAVVKLLIARAAMFLGKPLGCGFDLSSMLGETYFTQCQLVWVESTLVAIAMLF